MKEKANKLTMFFEISNNTTSCIVINGCNLVLKPKGEMGDSIIVDKERASDSELKRLEMSNLIVISKKNSKSRKEKKKKTEEEVMQERENKSQKGGSKVHYVDRGVVKTTKMSKHDDDIIFIDPN